MAWTYGVLEVDGPGWFCAWADPRKLDPVCAWCTPAPPDSISSISHSPVELLRLFPLPWRERLFLRLQHEFMHPLVVLVVPLAANLSFFDNDKVCGWLSAFDCW